MKAACDFACERVPMDGVLRTRCEESLATFYEAAAAFSGVDLADVLRRALRDQAGQLAKRQPRLKPLLRRLPYA